MLLALSILDAASEREKIFVDRWRERVAAGALDDGDDDAVVRGFHTGGGGGGVAGRGGFGGVRRGGAGCLASPAYLGQLLAEGHVIATVARYVIRPLIEV